MRHTLLVVTVKRWLKSVYIYGSYRKIKTGVSLFGPPGTPRPTYALSNPLISLAITSLTASYPASWYQLDIRLVLEARLVLDVSWYK